MVNFFGMIQWYWTYEVMLFYHAVSLSNQQKMLREHWYTFWIYNDISQLRNLTSIGISHYTSTWSASVARWPKAGRSLSSHRWWQCFQLPGRFPANGRSLTWWITSGRIIWSQRAKKSFGNLLTAARKHQSQTSRKKCWATRHMRIATSIFETASRSNHVYNYNKEHTIRNV